jgi:hypothetical protein
MRHREYLYAVNTETKSENRADLARVLLALAILAFLSGLDESRAPPDPVTAIVASGSR